MRIVVWHAIEIRSTHRVNQWRLFSFTHLFNDDVVVVVDRRRLLKSKISEWRREDHHRNNEHITSRFSAWFQAAKNLFSSSLTFSSSIFFISQIIVQCLDKHSIPPCTHVLIISTCFIHIDEHDIWNLFNSCREYVHQYWHWHLFIWIVEKKELNFRHWST